VNESAVTLKSHLSTDLGADVSDAYELVMALEEKFDIEIPDEVVEVQLDINTGDAFPDIGGSCSWSPFGPPTGYKHSPGPTGPNCIVENF
jgi:acyl carrier protein